VVVVHCRAGSELCSRPYRRYDAERHAAGLGICRRPAAGNLYCAFGQSYSLH